MTKRSSEALHRFADKPLLIILSSPSGAGKDTVLTVLKESGLPITHIITVTTRPPRLKEKDGVDYYFVSEEKFQTMLARNELLEYANVYGNWYGVPGEPIRRALDAGQDVIVKVDVQGAATIKRLLSQAVLIFLMPPTLEELATRLEKRNTESDSDMAKRIRKAEEEMKQLALFDYVVVNEPGQAELAAAKIKAIITAEKCRTVPRDIELTRLRI